MDSTDRKAAPDSPSGRGSKRSRVNHPPEAAPSQRRRLLRYLRDHGRADTLTIRRRLHILAPAARVWELRHVEGYAILTDPHPVSRIATYVLMPGGEHGHD